MNPDLISSLWLSAGFLLVFTMAEVGYRYLRIPAEYTRKSVHILGGFITFLFPLVLHHHGWVLLLSSLFFLLLWVSKRTGYLPSVHAVGRETDGGILYPTAVYGCFLAFTFTGQKSFFYVPMLSMALGDPAAALTGRTWPAGRYRNGKDTKTLSGSAAFLVVSLLCQFTFAYWITDEHTLRSAPGLLAGACIAGTVAEGLSRKGWDNVFIPAAILAVMFLLYL